MNEYFIEASSEPFEYKIPYIFQTVHNDSIAQIPNRRFDFGPKGNESTKDTVIKHQFAKSVRVKLRHQIALPSAKWRSE